MNDLTALIERLEQAEADHQADALHEALKFARSKDWITAGRYRHAVIMMNAEAYESAALTLVPSGHTWAAGDQNENDSAWACLTNADGTDFTGEAATPALALVIAALEARSAA